MATINSIQQQSSNLRTRKSELDIQLAEINARISFFTSKASQIKGITPAEKIEISNLKLEIDSLKQNKKLISRESTNLLGALNGLKVNEQVLIDPTIGFENLDDRYPLLLFPIRLETRFKKTGNQDQLWVRVYPDDCNIVKKESLISREELLDTELFWIEMAKAGGVESEERGAWTELVNSYGSNRAAWMIKEFKPKNSLPIKSETNQKVLLIISKDGTDNILLPSLAEYWRSFVIAKGDKEIIKKTQENLERELGLEPEVVRTLLESNVPINISDEFPERITAEQILVSKLIFPNPDEIVATQTSWNNAPQAMGLPDKFVAITYSDGIKRRHLFENPVKDNLPVGFDPSLEEGQISKDETTKEIQLNESLKWVVDFDKAVEAGMATRININPTEARIGFDQLFVLGVRLTSDPVDGKNVLEDLISSHRDSNEGFAILKQGTPTNNTEESKSEHSWVENPDDSYQRIFQKTEEFDIQSDYTSHSDGKRLAYSLGIDPNILQSVVNANGSDQKEAYSMNQALFPATMGYFMEEMMDPFFSESDISETKHFFSKYVSGRGPIPSFKIGKQPYGILPITSFSNLTFGDNNPEPISFPLSQKIPFMERLYFLIRKIDQFWDDSVSMVNYVGKEGDAHQILMDVLGLHPNSVEFHQRYVQSAQQIHNHNILVNGDNSSLDQIDSDLILTGKQILRGVGFREEEIKDLIPPILEKLFVSNPVNLTGPLVDDIPLSETQTIRAYSQDNKNYIEWLHSSDGNSVRLQNFGGNSRPNALLYLLLRHAVLLSQSSTATKMFLKTEPNPDKRVFFDPAFLHIQNQEIRKSKFEHLYSTNPTVTGDSQTTLIQHIYKNEILNVEAEAQPLKDILEALKNLEKVPTARLERLLVEHLDCCSYRIDSWKTALGQYQLNLLRNPNHQEENSQGVYLGAYGWLLDIRPKSSSLEEVSLSEEDMAVFNPNGKKIIRDKSNLGHIHAPSLDQAVAAAILRNAFDSNNQENSKNPFEINLTSERIRIANDFLEGIRNGQSLSALLGYQFERGLHDRYRTSGIEADVFIYPLRMAFPLVAENLISTSPDEEELEEAREANNLLSGSQSIELIEPRNVIDGLKLIHHVQESTVKEYPFDIDSRYQLPQANSAQSNAITQEVNRLMDIHDSIADLVMSEQVYQAVKGNFDHVSGVAEAFSKGLYPPEMEIINTPRKGLDLQHKLAIHFNASAGPNVSPNSIAEMTPKAKAEPALNEWLSAILPDPENVVCRVFYQNPGETKTEEVITQKDLGLQSIDLLFSATMESDQAMTEMDDRIFNFVRYEKAKHPFTKIEIKYTDDVDLSNRTIVPFFELAALIKSLRKILIGKQPVIPQTFSLPTGEANLQGPSFEYEFTEKRIEELIDGLQILFEDAKNLLNSVKSISNQTEELQGILRQYNLPESKINAFKLQFSTYLKFIVADQTRSREFKDEILRVFREILATLSLSEDDIDIITTSYEDHLEGFTSDFNKLDQFFKKICDLFMGIALYENNQTGTGFIHQQTELIFDEIINKLEVVLRRWEGDNVTNIRGKKDEFEEIMNSYDPSKSENELWEILKTAERRISSQSSFPYPDSLDEFKLIVETKGREFESVLNELKSIKSNSESKIIDFLNRTEMVLAKIEKHDVVPYDPDNNRNDLYLAKLGLINLKEDVYQALQNIVNELEKKIEAFNKKRGEITDVISEEDRLMRLIDSGKMLLGEEAIILPRFKFGSSKSDELQAVYDNREQILDFVKFNEGRVFPVDDWFSGVARVRKNAWDLENIFSLAQGLRQNTFLELTPLQFPYKQNDRWLALKFAKDKNEPDYNEELELPFKELKGDSLLYTAHFAKSFDKEVPICGIMIDEWDDVVPFKEENTGITFHYDQPNSEPPQTLLLVVPPAITGKWKWDNVIESMEETLAMAKKRAVEPSMLDNTNVAQFMPSTMMAVTTHLITVATNLALNNISTSDD